MTGASQAIIWSSLALLMIVVIVASFYSYRRHRRIAQARSLAALNILLAEADEIAQREAGGEPDSHT